MMTEQEIADLNRQYKELIPRWIQLLERLSVIVWGLGNQGFLIQSVSTRIKQWESVLEKLHRMHENRLGVISDLVGVRVLVSSAEDVGRMLLALAKEFEVPESISVNVTQLNSAHLFLNPNENSKVLSGFAGLGAEIQILTIEEDARRQIEHELNYKRQFVHVTPAPRSGLAQLEGVVQEFELILNRTDVHEKGDIHPFLERHPFLLYPNPEGVWPEVEIGMGKEFVMDFLIREPTAAYVLVELENPRHALFTANGDFTAAVNHAQRQVEDWQNWIEENQPMVERRFPDMLSPRALVVIGRSSTLDSNGRRRLARRNINLRGRVAIYTYDDLIQGARTYIDSLRKNLGTQ